MLLLLLLLVLVLVLVLLLLLLLLLIAPCGLASHRCMRACRIHPCEAPLWVSQRGPPSGVGPQDLKS